MTGSSHQLPQQSFTTGASRPQHSTLLQPVMGCVTRNFLLITAFKKQGFFFLLVHIKNKLIWTSGYPNNIVHSSSLAQPYTFLNWTQQIEVNRWFARKWSNLGGMHESVTHINVQQFCGSCKNGQTIALKTQPSFTLICRWCFFFFFLEGWEYGWLLTCDVTYFSNVWIFYNQRVLLL